MNCWPVIRIDFKLCSMDRCVWSNSVLKATWWMAAAVLPCSATAQLYTRNLHPARHPAPVVTHQPFSPCRLVGPKRLLLPAWSCLLVYVSARPSWRPELFLFLISLAAAGDRNSVGSTGSVGSTRSAGSGQSTESNNAPNGLQHNAGHHDNTNKVGENTSSNKQQQARASCRCSVRSSSCSQKNGSHLIKCGNFSKS